MKMDIVINMILKSMTTPWFVKSVSVCLIDIVLIVNPNLKHYIVVNLFLINIVAMNIPTFDQINVSLYSLIDTNERNQMKRRLLVDLRTLCAALEYLENRNNVPNIYEPPSAKYSCPNGCPVMELVPYEFMECEHCAYNGNDFELFWAAYPKKKNKDKALEYWNKKEGKPPIAEILAKIEAQKQTEQWTKDNGQFIPYPGSYINAGGWHDELTNETEMNGVMDFINNLKK